LEDHRIPVLRDFAPVPHSSRKGWVAKYSCFPENPFTADVDGARWTTRHGDRMSLREMAGRTARQFWASISALGDPLSLRVIAAVMHGRAPSLLELDDRPAAYDDVGRLCTWNDLFPITLLPRSRYERVLSNAIAGKRVRISGAWHRPVKMKGWTHVVFRRERDGAIQVRSLDDMLEHLDAWDRSAERRRVERRRATGGTHEPERRIAERRVPVEDTLERRRDSDQDVTPDKPSAPADLAAPEQAVRPATPQAPRTPAGRNEAPLVIITRTS
jgi:hypothetical protein